MTVLAAVLPGACVKRLPPAPTPPAVVPAVDVSAPVESGKGRLVIDVVDGPTQVHRVRMASKPVDNGQGRISYDFFESPEVLCAVSPCIADVPMGNVLVGFPVTGKDELESELLHVGPEPHVYRRALSHYDGRTGGLRVFGIIGTSVGGASLTTGAVLLPIGLADDIKGLTIAGGITLGVGAVLVAIGVWALRRDAPTFRPGSSLHFPISAAAR